MKHGLDYLVNSEKSRVLKFDSSRFTLLWTQGLVSAPFCNRLIDASPHTPTPLVKSPLGVQSEEKVQKELPYSNRLLHTASLISSVPGKKTKISEATFVSTLFNSLYRGQTRNASDVVRSSEIVGGGIANNLPIALAPSFDFPSYAPIGLNQLASNLVSTTGILPMLAYASLQPSPLGEKKVNGTPLVKKRGGSSDWDELAVEFSLQQQKKKRYKPSTGYAFRKPSGLTNSLEWRSYYAKLFDNKGYGCKGLRRGANNQPLRPCIGFSKKNRQYDQMLFNNCVIDISAPYPFGVVHLKQNYQRRLPSNRCYISDEAKRRDTSGEKADNIVSVQTSEASEATNWFKTPTLRCKVGKKQEANNNHFIEQGEVASPFFQNFKGVHKKTFLTNSKIMMRPFIMDEQVNKVGIGSFVTRTEIPILDCASNQRRFLSNIIAQNKAIDHRQTSSQPPTLRCRLKEKPGQLIKRACSAQMQQPTLFTSIDEQSNSNSQIASNSTPHRFTSSSRVTSSMLHVLHASSELESYTRSDEQGRQRMNVHSLSSENLKRIPTLRYLPASPLENLYNKFHTLPIFSTFIYKEWSHRFSFLDYFIWSARQNDLGLPFYNRRGACHTTRVNSINLIRNQIGAEGSKQFIFGFNGCTKNILWNERSQKSQLEHRFPSNSCVTRVTSPMLKERRTDPPKVGMHEVSAARECEKETFTPVASSSSIFDGDLRCTHYLISKNALQVIELRDKSSFYSPALSVQPVCLKKAFFSSRFSFYNLDGCIEFGASKTQQANAQRERSRLFAEMEDSNEKIEQFASNNCTCYISDVTDNTFNTEDVTSEEDASSAKQGDYEQSGKGKRIKSDLRNGCKVHQKETHAPAVQVKELIKKKVDASSVFRQIDKFFGWRSYAHVDSDASLINSNSQIASTSATFSASDCALVTSPMLHVLQTTSVQAQNDADTNSSDFAWSFSSIFDGDHHSQKNWYDQGFTSKMDHQRSRCTEGAKKMEEEDGLLLLPRSPRFDHSMQSATLFSAISNDNCPPSPSLRRASPQPRKNSAEMWGKVDDTQQFPRLAELLHFTGGTALRHLLSRFHLILLGKFIRHELKNLELKVNFLLALKMLTYSQGLLLGKLAKRRSKQIRRLKLLELFQSKKSNPEWMILSVLPVLPPDLRPILRVNDDFVVASDLNRLYQTVLRRNNTIHERLDDPLPCPESGLFRQRSLQKAVDGLLENGKGGGTPLCASKRRPLVSLSHVLKGKKGLFRQHLLGKRVDYSGRSVIVVGPKLNLHECGLPKEMALELFQPFLIHRLKIKGLATSNTTARRMIQQEDPIIWHTVKQLVYEHPVLLNRAPTLHRLGIQAFQPRLVSGRAILLHPLVCNGFNADFDGDQMAVHVPLSFQARAEAWKIMWSKNNLLSPATGQPILVPSQDMVLGCYYLSVLVPRVGSFKEAYTSGEKALPVHVTSTSGASPQSLTSAKEMLIAPVGRSSRLGPISECIFSALHDSRSVPSQVHVSQKNRCNVLQRIVAPKTSLVQPSALFVTPEVLHAKPFFKHHLVNEVAKINSQRFTLFSKPPRLRYFPGYFKKIQHLGFLTDTNFASTSPPSSSNSYASPLSHLIDRRLPFELIKNNTPSAPIFPAHSPLRFTGNALSASFVESRASITMEYYEQVQNVAKVALVNNSPIAFNSNSTNKFTPFHTRNEQNAHVISPILGVQRSRCTEGAKKMEEEDASKKVHHSAYHLKRGHYFSSLQDSLMAYSQGRLQTHTPFWVRLDYSVADVNENGTISHATHAQCTPSKMKEGAKVHVKEMQAERPSIDMRFSTEGGENSYASLSTISIRNENYPLSVLLKTAVVPSFKKRISQLLCDNTCTRLASKADISNSNSLLASNSQIAGTHQRCEKLEISASSLAPKVHVWADEMHVQHGYESNKVNSAFSAAPVSIKVSLHHNRQIKVQPHHLTIFHSQNELDIVAFSKASLQPFDGKRWKKMGESSWCKSATNDIEISSLVANQTPFFQPHYGRSQELSKILTTSSMHKENRHRCVIEGNDTLEAPLELRLAADGNLVKISTTFQNQYNCNATILDQYKERSIRYMRTTAGRVVINDKIVNLVNRNIF